MHRVLYLLLASFMVMLDQISKWFVTENLMRPTGEYYSGLQEWYVNAPAHLPYTSIEILPFFNLVMIWNRGISFGLFNQDSDYGPLILTVLAMIITIWFTVWLFMTRSNIQALSLALVIGGAIGNVIDRARFGAVIDFLDFHVLGYHWPAFNVADSCVSIGVVLLIIHSLFFEKKPS